MEKNKPSSFQPDMVIQGGTLLTMVEGVPPIESALICINGDRISSILTDQSLAEYSSGTVIIDARGCVIMPGLINAHGHTAMTLFRGLSDDLPLNQWLFECIFPAEAEHLNEETVYWGTLLGCLEMIASGTTTIIDGYFYQDSTAKAVHQSGLRGLIAQGIIDFPAPGIKDPNDRFDVGKAFLEQWLNFSDRITPGLFCHSPITCSEETLKTAMELSESFSVPLQIHLSETLEEVRELIQKTGQSPIHYLERIGVLNERLIAAHAVHLDDDEMALIFDKGVRVVHVPESNMKLASGVARIPEMLKRGIPVGIGTDGCASNNNLDLFREMDTAAKLHKVFQGDPECMDAETLLKMATTCGSKIAGLDKEIGSIEVGKKADIIVLDFQKPHLFPSYTPYSTIVYSADGSDVRDVIANGKFLLKDRVFQTLEPEIIIDKVTRMGRKIGTRPQGKPFL